MNSLGIRDVVKGTKIAIVNYYNENIISYWWSWFYRKQFDRIVTQKRFRVINIDKVSYSSNFYNTKDYKNNKIISSLNAI